MSSSGELIDNVPRILSGNPTTALGAVPLQLVANPQDIRGLELVYVGNTSISCNPGWCYIPSLGYSIAVAGQTLTGVTTAANSIMHYYISAAGTLSASTTSPVSYSGTAYQMTGNSGMRYIGSTSQTLANTIIRFVNTAGRMRYVAAAPLVYSGTTMPTTWTSVAISSLNIPLTTTDLELRANNQPNTASQMEFSNADAGFSTPTAGFLAAWPAGTSGYFILPVAAAGTFQYGMSATPTAVTVVVMLTGYYFSR